MNILATQTTASTGSLVPLFAVILVLFLFIIFCIMMLISTTKAKKRVKKEQKEQRERHQASLAVRMQHVHGLPIAENTPCTVYSTPDKYEIEVQGNTFNLDKNKVTDVSIKTETEVTNQYVSSIGGAIGGAVLFGPLGAVIGGRAKKKKSTDIRKYLIMTYESEGEIKYVGFDVTANYQAPALASEFQAAGNKHSATIDL